MQATKRGLGVAMAVAVIAPLISMVPPAGATVNGPDSDLKSWAVYLTASRLDTKPGSPARCTGTLIAPTWVLTADHCTYRDSGKKDAGSKDQQWHADDFAVLIQPPGRKAIKTTVSSIIRRDLKAYRNAEDDLALLRLPKPVDAAPLPLMENEAHVANSSVLVQQYGYGGTGSRLTYIDLTTGHAGPDTAWYRSAEEVVAAPNVAGQMCRDGDSGGPATRPAGGAQPQRLLGVFSIYNPSARYCHFVRVDRGSPHFEWIWKHINPGRPLPSLQPAPGGSTPGPANPGTGTPPPSSTPVNKSPVAAFTYTRRAGPGNIVTLDGRGSKDPDGSIKSWRWTEAGKTLATGATADVPLGVLGDHTVTLTVTDDRDATGAVSRRLPLGNRAPRILSVSPANRAVVGNNTPRLSANATDDDGQALTYTYRVSGPSVDLSSGTVTGDWTVPPSRLDPGTAYTWTVTARDSAGATATATSTFTTAMLPTANEMVATSTGKGYWQVATDGGVFSYGDAQFHGSAPGAGLRLTNVLGMARTPTDRGYWLVGRDGGVFAFGDAPFAGSLPGLGINVNNIVGMAPAKDGKGYWLVGADGGVFAFGSASFHGSMGGKPLNAPVEAIAVTPSGNGYWLVAKDGGVFAFGDAPFHGSMGGKHLNAPVVDIDVTPNGLGYWLVAEDGGVFAFGDAHFYGSLAGQHLNGRITGMATTPDGGGYWLNACDGGVFAFGNAPFYGSNPTYGCRGT